MPFQRKGKIVEVTREDGPGTDPACAYTMVITYDGGNTERVEFNATGAELGSDKDKPHQPVQAAHATPAAHAATKK